MPLTGNPLTVHPSASRRRSCRHFVQCRKALRPLPRARGKSALAGMLLNSIEGRAVVTAPAKGATEVIARFAGEHFHFMAPDALLAFSHHADWLIVDEAAAMPGPVLEKLVARFPRVPLTTTVQGYEGTGRGFCLNSARSSAPCSVIPYPPRSLGCGMSA